MSELLIKLYKNRFLKKIIKYKKPLTPSEEIFSFQWSLI